MIDSWSKLEEAIRFLQHQPLNHQKLVIKEHLESMVTHKSGEKIYNTETIVRAFKYYASSRSCICFKYYTSFRVSNNDIKGDERHRDRLKKPISSSEESNLKILLEIAAMTEKMHGKQGNRIKSLTRDTCLALEHTCNRLIEVSESLLLSG